MPRVNLDTSQTTSFEPLPVGAYQVCATKAELKTSQRSGDPMINWTLTVQDGEYTGRSLWLLTMLAGKGAFKTRELLEAVGVPCDGAQLDFDTEDVLNKDFIVMVSIEDYTNDKGETKPQNRVGDLLPCPKKKRQ